MKRRGFLGLLGAAVAGGPKVALQSSGMETLHLGSLGLSYLGDGGYQQGLTGGPDDGKSWAVNQLKRLKMMTPWVKALKRERFYLTALDPNTSSLVSVSMVNKMRISRNRQFERSLEMEDRYLKGVIGGLLD